MTEQKIKYNGFNPNLSIGIIGYGNLNSIQEIKNFFEMLNGFKVVYIKTSPKKLWIVEKEGAYE